MTTRMKSYTWDQAIKATAQIEKEAGTLQTIHAVACSILSHWASQKKPVAEVAEALNNLQNASPYHSAAFSEWVGQMTGLAWSKETEVWYGQKGQKLAKSDLDTAKGKPFWKVKPPSKPNPLTDEAVIKVLQGILDKQKRHEKKPVAGDDFSLKGNESIREAIKVLSAK